MKAAFSYLKRLAAWLWQGGHIFSGPLIAIGLPLVTTWLFPTELGFRSVGFLLQVLGVWIVWVGIRGTREQFEVPGSWGSDQGVNVELPALPGPGDPGSRFGHRVA